LLENVPSFVRLDVCLRPDAEFLTCLDGSHLIKNVRRQLLRVRLRGVVVVVVVLSFELIDLVQERVAHTEPAISVVETDRRDTAANGVLAILIHRLHKSVT